MTDTANYPYYNGNEYAYCRFCANIIYRDANAVNAPWLLYSAPGERPLPEGLSLDDLPEISGCGCND
jgi:hypothetical protein